jgi:hypothetical protein
MASLLAVGKQDVPTENLAYQTQEIIPRGVVKEGGDAQQRWALPPSFWYFGNAQKFDMLFGRASHPLPILLPRHNI